MNETPYTPRELRAMFESHEEKDEFRFQAADKAFAELRRDLLDEDKGVLPKMLVQTTKHNGRMRRVELILAVVLTAIAVDTLGGNSHIISIITSLL